MLVYQRVQGVNLLKNPRTRCQAGVKLMLDEGVLALLKVKSLETWT